MKKKTLQYLLAAIVLTFAQQTLALEVDREVMPRIQLGGRVMTSLDGVEGEAAQRAEDGFNLNDSSLLLRFDKRLYGQGVAGATFGLSHQEHGLQLQQLHTFYWNRDFAVTLGRTRLRNTLLEFPLMRDDDLLAYTHVGNASSDEEFDQIYAEQLAFDWFVDRRIQRLGVWAGSRRNDEDAAFDNAPNGIDSVGLGYVYEQPEDLRYVKRLRHVGITFDRQRLDNGGEKEWINAFIAGAEVNLNLNPPSSWSMAIQALVNTGLDGATSLTSVSEQARAKAWSLVTALRYTARPKLLTRWQAALTLAYKDYADVDDASQWSVAPSLFFRLGQGVDLLTQVRYTDYGDGLGGESDTLAQVGLAFSLDAMFNDTIGERDSILNLEHGYIQ